MTRWLVTGAHGMFGSDLLDVLAGRRPGDVVVAAGHADLDISDSAAVQRALGGIDVVVNCAAWTDVDSAESHEDEAFRVNAVGAATVARACAESSTWLLHVSTDYVFSGDASEPYPEDAPMAPRSAYGRTKAAGEWAVRTYLPDRSIILRSAWLYGWSGKNFVDTVLQLVAHRGHVDVVTDQRGQPTWTVDLAHRVVDAVDSQAPPGTYHATASGATTWHELAAQAVEFTGGDRSAVRPTTSDEFPRPAPRPSWSVLAHDGWGKAGLEPMRDWRAQLTDALRVRDPDRPPSPAGG